MDFVFTSAFIKRFLFLIFVSLASLAVLQYLPSTQNYWCVYTLLLLSFVLLGNTFFERVLLLFVTGTLSALFAFIAGMLAAFPLILAIYLSMLVAVSLWLAGRRTEYFFPLFIVALLTLLSGCNLVSSSENFSRLGFIVLGTVVVTFFQIIFFWRFSLNELNFWLTIAVKKLSNVSSELISCFLHLEYIDNVYLFERRLHVQKNKFMQARVKLDGIVRPKGNQSIQPVLTKLDQLFALLLDLAQLRRRVSDYTIFGICRDELNAIDAELKKVFADIVAKKSIQANAEHLTNKIQRFEETYNHVLRVTAREPLVFLLFISSLKKLNGELVNFAEAFSGAHPL